MGPGPAGLRDELTDRVSCYSSRGFGGETKGKAVPRQSPSRLGPKEGGPWPLAGSSGPMAGRFVGGARGVLMGSTGHGVQMPWFQPWLLTYSVTLHVSDFSVPQCPLLEHEANDWVIARTQ